MSIIIISYMAIVLLTLKEKIKKAPEAPVVDMQHDQSPHHIPGYCDEHDCLIGKG